MEKRFSQGLSFLLAFTGQKLIDNYSVIENLGNNTGGIQNIYNEAAERAVSPNDISKRLVVSGLYQIPFGRGQHFGSHWNRAVDAFAGGWQLNGIATYQTGFPLSVTTQNTCTNCGNNSLRPNNNGQSAALSGPVSSRLNRYLNSAVFCNRRRSPSATPVERFPRCALRVYRTSIFPCSSNSSRWSV